MSWLDRDRFPVVLLLTAILAAACLMPAQSDTWWQLRAGEEIWRTGRVVMVDQFTHTVEGHHWPDHEWLTQVLFFALHWLGGMPLLTGACALAVAVAWAVISTLTPGPGLLRATAIGVGATLSAIAWSVRPQVLTMALLAVTLWILVRRRGVWFLPPLFLLWANLHGAVALGALLVAAATVASIVLRDGFHRTLIPVGALCFIATILTPMGWKLWLWMPSSLRRLQAFEVLEWLAPGFTQPAHMAFWIIGLSAIALMVFQRRVLQQGEALTPALATLFLFVISVRSARHIPPFLLCAVPTLAILLDVRSGRPSASKRHRFAVNGAVLAVVVAGAGAIVGSTWQSAAPRLRWTPLAADTIAAISACDGRLYNRYDEGGYLIWFMKERKVFIDSRQDPFPDALVLEHVRVERTGDYRALFERYEIACALTPLDSPLALNLRRDGWIEHPAGPWSVYQRHELSIVGDP